MVELCHFIIYVRSVNRCELFSNRSLHWSYCNYGHAEVDGGVAVRNRLGLDALRSVDDEQRAFARGERTAHFIGEVE